MSTLLVVYFIIFRKDYVFWISFNYDRIVRGQGIETPSTITNLVTSDISCAGMHFLLSRILFTLLHYEIFKDYFALSVSLLLVEYNDQCTFRWTGLGLDK